MKNTIATVCIVTMLLNVASINANAVNTQPTTPAMNDIAVEYMGHGLYQATNDIALASSKKAIISRADDTDVFKIDDIYVIPVNGAENFIEVTPVEVDLSDKNTIKQTCARYSISKEIEQDLLDLAELQQYIHHKQIIVEAPNTIRTKMPKCVTIWSCVTT